MPSPEIRVLIADDEPAARRGVRQLLAAYPAFAVVGECRDGAEVLARLDALAPHVVFLDVAMPDVDGFEVIRRRTPERMPEVVFLTAYDTFAIRAFEAQALDYLLKPVTEERFAATMKRLVRRFGERAAVALDQRSAAPLPTRSANSLHERSAQPSVAAPAEPEQGIAVPSARGIRVLPLREIDWIESADNYVRLWRAGRGHLLRESLHAIEARVQAHGFVRAHRRALVRLDGVRALTWTRTGTLVAQLACGVRIPVSRRRRTAFVAAVRGRGVSEGR